ncbi:UNVERIFIED_CONTAM: hypothetical protein FKN15_012213 [Acipenser sinensis]
MNQLKRCKYGAEKRREKEAKKLISTASSCTPLTSFFVKKSKTPPADNDGLDVSNMFPNEAQASTSGSAAVVSERASSSESDTPAPVSDSDNSDTDCEDTLHLHDSKSDEEDVVFELNTQEPYPTDPYLFKDQPLTPAKDQPLTPAKDQPLTPATVRALIEFNSDHRRFNVSWYKRQANGTCNVDRHWLIYSTKSGRLNCFCCWLFADRKSVHYSDNWADPNLGFSKFQKGTEKIEKHEESLIHREAEKTFLMTKYGIKNDNTNIMGVNMDELLIMGVNMDELLIMGANVDELLIMGANVDELLIMGVNMDELLIMGVNGNKLLIMEVNGNKLLIISLCLHSV